VEITVTVKNVYGTDTVYPVCDKAKLFCQLTGRKTLTANDLAVISKLGYAVRLQENIVRPEWIYGK
jgi:hypothetical protein